MTIREIIKRDIGVKIEGVVKVFDRAALASEFREYVVTDKIEDEFKKILDTFTQVSDTLRRGGRPRDVMGMWVSGFFGSGKSHFAKVLGYLLQNEDLGDGSGERCIDVFLKHLSDTPRGRDIRLRLGEIKQTTQIKTLAFEIRSRQSLNNPSSVGEVLLGEFYRSIGLSENFIVARIERRLARRGLLAALEMDYQTTFGIPWKSAEGRDDLMTVRRRLGDILPRIDPGEWADVREAKKALDRVRASYPPGERGTYEQAYAPEASAPDGSDVFALVSGAIALSSGAHAQQGPQQGTAPASGTTIGPLQTPSTTAASPWANF